MQRLFSRRAVAWSEAEPRIGHEPLASWHGFSTSKRKQAHRGRSTGEPAGGQGRAVQRARGHLAGDGAASTRSSWGAAPTRCAATRRPATCSVCTLEDTFTPAERNLVELGEHERVRDMRIFSSTPTCTSSASPSSASPAARSAPSSARSTPRSRASRWRRCPLPRGQGRPVPERDGGLWPLRPSDQRSPDAAELAPDAGAAGAVARHRPRPGHAVDEHEAQPVGRLRVVSGGWPRSTTAIRKGC